jgi:hypothetical protein
VQLHPIEPHLDALSLGVSGKFAIGREKRQLRMALRILVKRFDRAAPIVMLTIADLAQIQHLPLHHLATGASPVLDDAPSSSGALCRP